MAMMAGASMLGAMGHLANLGQFVEIGQGHAYQREQMQWARRAYFLDSRALRIDLLNAVKEDVRDHHTMYAGRIDTLLLVHTLFLTFALATLQYSDEFIPSSDCSDCAEALHPWIVTWWVWMVAVILILPFWSIVMLIWCKLQLDGWLETSIGRLNRELKAALAVEPRVRRRPDEAQAPPAPQHPVPSLPLVGAALGAAGALPVLGGAGSAAPSAEGGEDVTDDLLDMMEDSVARLSGFVSEHQASFKHLWGQEGRSMILAATSFLWVSAAVAILITAGMFWLFLENRMEGAHSSASAHFALSMSFGLVAPAAYLALRWPFRAVLRSMEEPASDEFEDCVEATERPAGGVATGDGPRSGLLGEDQRGGDGRREGRAGLLRRGVKGLLGTWSRRTVWVEMSDSVQRPRDLPTLSEDNLDDGFGPLQSE